MTRTNMLATLLSIANLGLAAFLVREHSQFLSARTRLDEEWNNRLQKVECQNVRFTDLTTSSDRVLQKPGESPHLSSEDLDAILRSTVDILQKNAVAFSADQRHRSEQKNIQRILDYLEKELALSKPQREDLSAVYQQYYREREILQGSGLSPEEELSRVNTIRTQLYQSIQGILLPDQFTKFQEIRGLSTDR